MSSPPSGSGGGGGGGTSLVGGCGNGASLEGRRATSSREGSSSTLVGGGGAGLEGMRGLLCGLLFGLAAPLVGQPLDTIKTRMQADAAYARGGALATARGIVAREGLLALYRGLLPPLLGSTIFRSVQISVYAAAYAGAGGSAALCTPLPGSGGLQPRVLLAAAASSTARALIETPLELIKVRQQTGQRWLRADNAAAAARAPLRELRGLYSGFGVTWARTMGLMTTFFVLVDALERNAPQLVAVPVAGPFLKGGVCATMGWVVVWPFEVLKSQIQAKSPGVPDGAGALERARHVLATRGGVLGLYRGIGPGCLRSMLANGCSMVVFSACQAALRSS